MHPLQSLMADAGHFLLIGDSSEAFADCCLRIMNEGSLRDSLTKNALELIQSHSKQRLENYSLTC